MSAGADVRRHPLTTRLAAPPLPVGAVELAWIALVPCALVTIAAIVLLGPSLGHLLFAPGSNRLWPPGWWETMGRPEPTKQSRYLIAALAPALLFAAILAGPRRVALRPLVARAMVVAGQATLLALVTVALIDQHPLAINGSFLPATIGLDTLVPAGAVLLAALLVLRSPARRARLSTLGRETPRRRWVTLAIVAGLVAVWLLEAPTTDRLVERTIGLSGTWTLNDAIAVLDGRTPLVDYHPIYAKLLPYPTAIALWAFGTTTLVYTTFMAVLSGLTLLAVYSIFRTVVRSSLRALALFVPFLVMTDGGAGQGFGAFSMPAQWPMRFGSAYLLAWLTVQHLAGRRPRRAWVVFFVAGLMILNSLEFGMAATAATLAAWLCARPPGSVREAARLAANVVGGVLGAVVLVSAWTLVRAGALPDPELLLEWPRIFTTLGWFSLPLRAWDLHLAMYATFVACVAVAAIRLSRRDDDAILTSMLMWSGVFGLLAGGYYIGRPDIVKLTTLFSPWSFALTMLTVVALTGLGDRSWRPTLPRLLVLFGIAVSICTWGGFAQPWRQVSRLGQHGTKPQYLPRAEQFVGRYVGPGEKVAILLPMSYRISHDLGLRNVAPYGFMNAIVTRAQMQTLVDVLRREQVTAIFTPQPNSYLAQEGDAAPEQLQVLLDVGYRTVADEAGMVAFRSG